MRTNTVAAYSYLQELQDLPRLNNGTMIRVKDLVCSSSAMQNCEDESVPIALNQMVKKREGEVRFSRDVLFNSVDKRLRTEKNIMQYVVC